MAAGINIDKDPEYKIGKKWRKRMGVEPIGDRVTCHPPVLKTGTITGTMRFHMRFHSLNYKTLLQDALAG